MKWQRTILNGFCAVVALAMLAAAAWAAITGQIGDTGVDGLFLVAVCLFLALLFAILPAQAVRERLLWQRGKAVAVEEKEKKQPVAAAVTQRQE
jgi:hypothetical protein